MAVKRRAPAKKSPAKKTGPKSAPSKKPAPKKTAPKKAVAASRAPAAKSASRRADLGAPIDGFFARQPPHLRAILEALRRLIEEAAPDAASSIKWGMPFFALDGVMLCALTAHRAHVNLVLVGPPTAFADPEGRLRGEGRGRHLKLTRLEELPTEAVRSWLRTAVEVVRAR